jgi:uncharacterized protein YgiM (DUF1202 family)
MKKQLVLVATSVAILMAASSAFAVRAGSNSVNVNDSLGRTVETMTPSNRSILIPSQTTQEVQLNLNQNKNSRQILISQGERVLGCASINDPAAPTNIRSGPGTSHSVVDTLDNGAFVSIYERKKDWARITPHDSSIAGWVAIKLLKAQPCS